MKKYILTSVVTMGLVLGAGIWLYATPSVGPAVATPSYVVLNAPTPVLFTVTITDPSVIQTGINLFKTDANGKAFGSAVGSLADDGKNGDALAGDKTFSVRLTLNQATVGPAFYRVSAAFRGVVQRSQSAVAIVTVDPFKLPPDPGDAGKQTVEGIDSDNDGIRDDLQRYIGITYRDSADQRRAASQYALAVLRFLADAESETRSLQHAAEYHKGQNCTAHVFGLSESISATDDILALAANTKMRAQAYFRADAHLSGHTFQLPPEQDNVLQCAFITQ